MTPRMLLAALALGLAPDLSIAQEIAKKTPAAVDQEAEVLFANGSKVRMAILQENFEVQTDYGKLTIPLKDLRRIDFGLHLPPGAEGKIAVALKKLNSPQFKERDAAA